MDSLACLQQYILEQVNEVQVLRMFSTGKAYHIFVQMGTAHWQ
jgi:hypothetical protein